MLSSVQLNLQEEEKTEDSKVKKTTVLSAVILMKRLKKLLKDAFYKFYPTVKLILKLVTLLLHIFYLADKTSSISIVQLLSKISYARITRADHVRVESQLSPQVRQGSSVNVPPTLSSIILSNLQSLAPPIRKIAWTTTDTILPVSIFLLKFLEWYNANRNAQGSKDDDDANFATPIVPPIVPPDALNLKDIKDAVTTTDAFCRICHKEMHNPAIIETGYVFCYKCIYEYLRDQPKDEGGRCPVTGRRLLGCSWGETRNEWIVKGVRRIII